LFDSFPWCEKPLPAEGLGDSELIIGELFAALANKSNIDAESLSFLRFLGVKILFDKVR